MTTDSAKSFAGLDGALYVAPVGEAFPGDIDTAPAGNWTDLGSISTDGITFNQTEEKTEIQQWQGGGDTFRILANKRVSKIACTLQEFVNVEAFKLVFGGGTFTGGKYTPAATGTEYNRAVVLDLVDGTNKLRFLVQKATNVADVEASTPTDNLVAPSIDLQFLAPTAGEVYEVDSNLTAWGAS